MKIYLLLALVSAASCSLVGKDRCVWGPGYWCSDVRLAKECGAVNHCASTVWKLQRLDSIANSESCVVCQLVVNKVREEIQKVPKDEIGGMLSKMCVVLSGKAKTECENLMTNYLPEVIQLITSSLDSKAVCAAITMCPGFEDKLHHAAREDAKTFIPKVHDDLECQLCKQAIAELKQLDQDQATQAAITDFLENKVCPLLGAKNETCVEYVKMYAPVVFQIIASELDPQNVCTALKLCTAHSEPRKAELLTHVQLEKSSVNFLTIEAAKPIASDTTCVLCQFLVKEIDSLLAQNASEKDIEQALDKFCSILPTTIRDECTSFVGMYAPAIIDLLVKEIDPRIICTDLKLCTSSTRPKASDLECDLCQQLINYFNEFLNENSTTQEIEKVLDMVCNYLPDSPKDQCLSLVKEYGPALVQLIKEFDDPLKVCQAIKLCQQQQQTGHPLFFREKVGTHKCSQGPAYWCASRANAEQCRAVEHCQKHGWN